MASRKTKLLESVAAASYHQSLVNLQQYANSCGMLLFQRSRDAPSTGEEQKQKGSENAKRKRYLQGAINCALLALKSIVKSQRSSQAGHQQEGPEQKSKLRSGWRRLDFLDQAKLVLQQMLSILQVRIKVFNLKNVLVDQQAAKDEKKLVKGHTLKQQAFLIALVADQLDVFAAPSNDPRINQKLKQNSSHNICLSVLQILVGCLQDSTGSDPQSTAQQNFLSLEKTEECLNRISEVGQ